MMLFLASLFRKIFSFLKPPSSPFDPPPLLYSFVTSPLTFLVHHIYTILLWLRGPSYPTLCDSRIRLVCISDTHTLKPPTTETVPSTHVALPPGDVLIHAGDLSNDGSFSAIQDQISWLSSLPYKHKIVIAGNHDSYFDPRSRLPHDRDKTINWGSVHYLQHSSLTLDFPEHGGRTLAFYGAPQIPACGGPEFAFQYPRGEDAWSDTIPMETDVLITHTPPKYHLDLPDALGCEWLLKELWRVRPRVHVFGHVHAGFGNQRVWWDGAQKAYERIKERRQSLLCGLDFIDVRKWLDAAKMLWCGVLGVLWSRIWGGEGTGGILVNAALMYNNTGRLGNAPTVVYI